MITSEQALQNLKEGNKRFQSNICNMNDLCGPNKRAMLAKEQKPYAIILGCSDSRVPAEIVFDQGLGDLFVIRVAGNIVAPSQIGSVEFAVSSFGTPLVVVLGHANCGAIHATIDVLENGEQGSSDNIMSIVNHVKPAIKILMRTELKNDKEKLVSEAIRANVEASVHQLKYGSKILELAVANKELMIVGAKYDLESGVVEFYD